MKTPTPHPRDPWFNARLLGVAVTAAIALGSAAVRSHDDAGALGRVTAGVSSTTVARASTAPAAPPVASAWEAQSVPH